MTLIFSILTNNLTAIVYVLKDYFILLFDRGCKCKNKDDDKYTRQMIQSDYELKNTG